MPVLPRYEEFAPRPDLAAHVRCVWLFEGGEEAEDQRIANYVDSLDAAKLEETFTYRKMTTPEQVTSKLWPDLLHFFNHQTHHRGQAHTALSLITGQEPPSLDMIVYARARG